MSRFKETFEKQNTF